MTAEPKMKFPLDLTAWQNEKLTRAATDHRTNKKALIFSALKIAYGIDLTTPDQDMPQGQNIPPVQDMPPAGSQATTNTAITGTTTTGTDTQNIIPSP